MYVKGNLSKREDGFNSVWWSLIKKCPYHCLCN